MPLKGIFNFEALIESRSRPNPTTMIVCLCHAVRDRDLDAAIAEGASTVEEVGRACGAGTGCGACIPDVEDRLAHGNGCGDCPRSLASVRSRTTEARDAAP